MKNQKENSRFWIWGKHAVMAVLRGHRRKIFSLIATAQALKELEVDGVLLDYNIKPEIVDVQKLSQILGKDALHQGCAALVAPLNNSDFKAFVEHHQRKDRSLIVALDQLTDPHNVGAIMRSALAFSADAILSSRDNSTLDGPTIARSSAGALERINILKVTNLVSALKTLKDAGYWVVGLEALAANVTISKIAQYPKVVLVLGAEGSGMRPLTRQHCDIVMQVPMSGDMESLNVSNAAAIAMFCYNNTQGG